jgi:hypothetical protein
MPSKKTDNAGPPRYLLAAAMHQAHAGIRGQPRDRSLSFVGRPRIVRVRAVWTRAAMPVFRDADAGIARRIARIRPP